MVVHIDALETHPQISKRRAPMDNTTPVRQHAGAPLRPQPPTRVPVLQVPVAVEESLKTRQDREASPSSTDARF